MAEVSHLHFSERIALDRDRIGLLVRELGDAAAERVVDRALEEISIRLSSVEAAWEGRDLVATARAGQSLIAISDQIGMHLLAHVACDVAALARLGDGPALGAAVARLSRVGERSFVAMWDAVDIRI